MCNLASSCHGDVMLNLLKMNEFKGTKGKWTIYTASVPSLDRPTKHSVYTGCKRIALCYNLFENDKTLNVDEQESEYNANLISHSPEMLEFIKSIVDDYNDGLIDDVEHIAIRSEQLFTRATTIQNEN